MQPSSEEEDKNRRDCKEVRKNSLFKIEIEISYATCH